MLPPTCLDHLKNFYVRYDNPSDRGLAGKDTAIISGNVPDDEFRALLFHEVFGHVVDLGCLQGTPSTGKSEFRDGNDPIYRNDPSLSFYRISWNSAGIRKQNAKRDDFVSGYAYEADPFEDLAESVTFYALHRSEFETIASGNAALKQKFQWIQKYVFPNHSPLVSSTFAWDAEDIPWDTTKLPYRWLATVQTAQR
jgi:hypothetical protein